jgi:tetratricopeptide (TPR) repeat protein
MGTLQVYPLSTRLANAVHSYAAYIGKLVWPSRLAVLYPYVWNIPAWQIALSALAIVLLTLAALILARRRPWLPVGWFWFLIALFPVIGVVQVGGAAMADRYSYIPSVGLFVMAAWEAMSLLAGRSWTKPILGVAAAAILAGCLAQTSRQLTYWRDSLSLFSHTIAVTPNNAVAHCNLATALEAEGKLEQAKEQLRLALALSPGYASADDNLGLILYNQGDLKDAEAQFRAALKDNPKHDRAWANLGLLLLNSDRSGEAIEPLEHAVQLTPDNAYAQLGLARALDDQGKFAEALPHYQAAVTDKPDLADAQANLGAALSTEGKLHDAAAHLEKALALDPHSWEAHYFFGNTLLAGGKFAPAAQNYRKAALLRPQNPYIQLNLAAALQRLGQTNDAIAAAERCLQLATNSADADLAARLKKQLASLRAKH